MTTTLWSSDPQPGWGAVVRDCFGRKWENTGGEEGTWANWQQTDETQPDPETWIKVAGNYGPVTLVTAAASGASTLTVTEFVLARIAEDEAAAREAADGAPHEWSVPFAYIDLVERYDPARVLAQCAAMRKIVEGMRPYGPIDDINAPEVIGALASIWSDHPDFREEWRA